MQRTYKKNNSRACNMQIRVVQMMAIALDKILKFFFDKLLKRKASFFKLIQKIFTFEAFFQENLKKK